MVRRRRTIAIACAGVVVAAAAGGQTRTTGGDQPERFEFGRPATHAEIDAWDIDVMSDGHGLPDGQGTAATIVALIAESPARVRRLGVQHGECLAHCRRRPIVHSGLTSSGFPAPASRSPAPARFRRDRRSPASPAA